MKKNYQNSIIKMISASVIIAIMSIVPRTTAASTSDKIKESGTITVATEAIYPPLEFLEHGKIVGNGNGKDILDSVIAAPGQKLEQFELPL